LRFRHSADWQAGLTPDKPRPPITQEDLRAVLRINLRFDLEDVQLHANDTAVHLQQREQVYPHCPYHRPREEWDD
jgi:hypothetical protein